MRRTMGDFQAAIDQASVQASMGATADPSTFPISSPWSSSNLQRIVFEDIFGSDIPVNTRAQAMRIPTVRRGRNLIVNAIAPLPLKAKRGADVLPDLDQPTFLYRTDGDSPQHRIAWTIDDLMFYGWSCWWRENSTSDRFPLKVGRINFGDWAINDDNKVEINGQPVPDDQVILFSAFDAGVLTDGCTTIADAVSLYKIVRQRLQNPVPGLELHQETGPDLTEPEIDALIDRWSAARNGQNGGVAYTSKGLTTKELGADADAQLLIEARNATSVDLARLIGITAGMVDATAPKASLNYETTTGRNQEFSERDLAPYMTPITARLSQDDVCPAGQSIGFDSTSLTAPIPPATGPIVQD